MIAVGVGLWVGNGVRWVEMRGLSPCDLWVRELRDGEMKNWESTEKESIWERAVCDREKRLGRVTNKNWRVKSKREEEKVGRKYF